MPNPSLIIYLIKLAPPSQPNNDPHQPRPQLLTWRSPTHKEYHIHNHTSIVQSLKAHSPPRKPSIHLQSHRYLAHWIPEGKKRRVGCNLAYIHPLIIQITLPYHNVISRPILKLFLRHLRFPYPFRDLHAGHKMIDSFDPFTTSARSVDWTRGNMNATHTTLQKRMVMLVKLVRL